MKINPWPKKFSSNLLWNPNGGFLTIGAQKTWKMTKPQKLKIGKKAKIRDDKILQDIPLHL